MTGCKGCVRKDCERRGPGVMYCANYMSLQKLMYPSRNGDTEEPWLTEKEARLLRQLRGL